MVLVGAERASAAAESGSRFVMPFGPETQGKLQQAMGVRFAVATHMDISQLHRVLNGVRNAILEWTLQLEKDGIRGEGMTFSADERRVAESAQYVVNNFWGWRLQTAVRSRIR